MLLYARLDLENRIDQIEHVLERDGFSIGEKGFLNRFGQIIRKTVLKPVKRY